MCSPLEPLSCPGLIHVLAGTAGDATAEAILSTLNTGLHAGIKTMTTVLASWILVPSTQLCPGADQTGTGWIDSCATSAAPAATLRAWTLPVTALVAILGLLWQAITMAITRKGEPLLYAIRGLAGIAVWGAVGIAGTQLAMRAGDAYAFWILQRAVFGDSPNPVDTLGTKLADLSPTESAASTVVLVLLNVPILFATLAQVVLMVFREGSVVILAGLLQLAAAGGFTRLTSGWLAKVTGWMLALIAYKPIAATIYATAFALLGGDSLRNFVMGLTVIVLALVAMPALMRLFNWTVGSLASGGSGLGVLGAAAAGTQAAAAMRSIGGYRATDHAAYLSTHGPTPPTPAPHGGTAPIPPAPAGAGLTAATASTFSGAGATSASGGATAAGAAGAAAAGAATAGAATAAYAAAQTAAQTGRQVANAATDPATGR